MARMLRHWRWPPAWVPKAERCDLLTGASNEMAASTDIHTLARQMGTSVLMLERFYSKVSATMAAEDLA
jgi:hypothetical protein